MKPIFFITGNKDTLRKVRTLIPAVQGIDIDLTEIQEIDVQKIIIAKLAEAQKHQVGPFIIEDTSLSLPRDAQQEWAFHHAPDRQAVTANNRIVSASSLADTPLALRKALFWPSEITHQ